MSQLKIKRISDEQSEVWRDGFAPHQISTEAVLLEIKLLCSSEVVERFSKNYPGIGDTTIFDDPNADSIANALEIAGKK